MNRFSTLFLALIIILFISPTMSWAGEKEADIKMTTWQDIFSDVVGHYPLSIDQTNASPGQKGKLNIPKNWIFDFGLQRFLMSHTSYEIGNSDGAMQKPMSRLEFPLDTWWLDFRLRRTCPRWSIGARSDLSVDRNTDERFKDSDWLNPEDTGMKTVYSESACRLENSYLFRGDVDVNISDWLGLPPSFEIRPLFAFEFQRLNFMAHDGVMWDIGSYNNSDAEEVLVGVTSATALPGDMIHFRQDYYMYQIGLRGVYDGFKIGKYINIKATGEADWGPVLGYNEDHHLLNGLSGRIKSSGNSLYFSTGLEMVFAKTITAGVSMDYLYIRTTGVERQQLLPKGVAVTWPDGVKAWSDQTSLIAHVSYSF